MWADSLLEQGAGALNEDWLIVDGDLFGVFDGCTSLTPATYEGGRTGGFLASHIAAEAFQGKRASLTESAELANRSIRLGMVERGVDLTDKRNLWSVSAAVVRIQNGVMEWVQIGDCRILCVRRNGGFSLLCDIPHQDVETLSLWQEAASFTDAPIGVAMHEQIVKVRRRMNEDYGVFSGEPEAMAFLQTGSCPLDDIGHVLLFTDGLLLPVENPREERGYGELVGLYLRSGLQGVRDHIRRIEATDAGCRIYPRFKTHDDIAAIAIDCRSGIHPD
ncbi:protein phosphatase 2C domain-containing protein [Pseudodesulfovibrio thermohalotolerans]|uniref:protein phosphatase 2C domain-containing protein n=1 Tax=Pseudodesulfovibrio thermohalotolerans TaxID=2880651 RepID=UPI0024428FB8|nr:protein phosphatase 2C domain-containing protein [Pseudodesulfovibrio thermohalotolerans]WFS63072.1 protein phosphatase 2C domain-containing protein [Pseudodesulfovibrio thermohalotolerans]